MNKFMGEDDERTDEQIREDDRQAFYPWSAQDEHLNPDRPLDWIVKDGANEHWIMSQTTKLRANNVADILNDKPLLKLTLWDEKEIISGFFADINFELTRLSESQKRNYLIEVFWKIFKWLINVNQYKHDEWREYYTSMGIVNSLMHDFQIIKGESNWHIRWDFWTIYKNLTWIEDKWFSNLTHNYIINVLDDAFKRFFYHAYQICLSKENVAFMWGWNS